MKRFVPPFFAVAVVGWAGAAHVSLDVYEVYTELTVGLDKPAPFTCKAGEDPGTVELVIGAPLKLGPLPPPGGHVEGLRVTPAEKTTTLQVKTGPDAGTFRAYATAQPAAVVLDVFRRLATASPPREASPFANFLGGRKILLVDDDDGPGNGNKMSVDVDGKYKAALKKLGVAYDEYVVPAGRNGPGAEKLAAYPIVVWFTGLDARPAVITSADEAGMASYVLNGGRLLLVSQNYISDAGGGKSKFGKDILGIKSYKPDTQYALVTCGPTGRLPLAEYLLNTELTIIGNWGDGFEPQDPGECFFRTADGLSYGVVRPAGTGKVAFFSCAIENVGYVSRLADIIAAALDELSGEE